MTDIPVLRRLLKEHSTIAVVGLSHKRHRASYYTSKYMQNRGYRIIPVNPKYQEVLGEKCYPTLLEISEKVDIVNCFRKSADIPPIVADAIQIGARAIWMQLGIINEAAAKHAQQAGLEVVMNRCIMVEHRMLLGDADDFEESYRK